MPVVAAQANGKPVVAYNVGAHSEVVVNKKTGFLVEDLLQFKECLKLLLRDPELRRKMGEAAAKHAKKFTWDASIEKIRRVIDILCERYGIKTF